MISKAKNRFYAHLARRKFDNDEEMHLYITLTTAAWFATLMHLFLFVFYIFYDTVLLSYINILSLAIYGFGFYLIHEKKYAVAGLLFAIDVAVYTFVSILMSAHANYTVLYYVIILIMQILIPYAPIRTRIVMIACIWVLAICSIFIESNAAIPATVTVYDKILRLFNMNATIIAVIIELSLNNVVSKMLEDYKTVEIKELEEQAYQDPLTSLYNRRYAEMVFKEIAEDRRPQHWYVAMADIDDFKHINDTYGHGVGDEVLRFLAQFFKLHFRETDYLFRWGGEEFLLLLKDVTKEDAYRVLDKARDDLAQAIIRIKRLELSITITIGAAALNQTNIEESIERSDKNLYIGKTSGKNKVVL